MGLISRVSSRTYRTQIMTQRCSIEKQPIKLKSLTYTNAYQSATKILKNNAIINEPEDLNKNNNPVLTIKSFPHNSQFARLFIHTSRQCIGQCCRLSLRDKLVLIFLNLPEKSYITKNEDNDNR